MKKVVVVGQGYVGLPIAMRAVEAGYDVVGFEKDPHRVGALESGKSFVEDVSNQEVAAALRSGKYFPTSDPGRLEMFDYAIVTVPTPLKESLPDLSFIEAASHDLSHFIRPGCTVILESTTYPGTTEELMTPILEKRSNLRAGTDFWVGYSPERIDPGNQTWNFRNTPKVVSGISSECLRQVSAFYSSLVDTVVEVKGCREAELTKLLENTFRHVNIALVNELAIFAHQLNIDVWNAIDAASTKPFGFMRFTPGPGVGGHCLPIDPSYLAWRVRQTLGHSFRFVELANDINEHMPDYTVTRLTLALNRQARSVRSSRILLIGLAYKKNSSDARESPAAKVASLLLELGAIVEAIDPHIREVPKGLDDLKLVSLEQIDLSLFDAVLILTDHDNINYEKIALEARLVLDTRRRLPQADNVEVL
jgi:UDP-N-acetyl-D-glucosamine dehydrogenase